MILARKWILVLIVLTAVGGSIAYLATELGLTGSRATSQQIAWLVFALMGVLSILMGLFIWRSYTRSLEYIRTQLRYFDQDDRIGMIMIDARDELADLVAEINHYLTQMRVRIEVNQQHQKELEMQAGAAEAELKQMESVIFSISEAVMVTDQYDELLLANSAAESLFQFRLKDCYRGSVSEVLADAELGQLIIETRWQKAHQISRKLERQAPDGSKTLSLKVMLSSVVDTGGDVIGVVVVIHDMTAEQEIARLKDDFVSSISHELKTPLASIRACAEMLEDEEAQNEQARREMSRIIHEQSHRLTRLIDNILNISRIESGLAQVNQSEVNISEVIHEVTETLSPQSRDKNIMICSDVDSSLVIWGDYEMISQAVMNLVNNAVKYSQAGGHILIRGMAGEMDEVVIEVQDEGAGIPQECQDKIFQKFYRVPEHQRLSSGTGLGLHLVRQIVEVMHSGRVELDSRVGRGSLFRLVLPKEVPSVKVDTKKTDQLIEATERL